MKVFDTDLLIGVLNKNEDQRTSTDEKMIKTPVEEIGIFS